MLEEDLELSYLLIYYKLYDYVYRKLYMLWCINWYVFVYMKVENNCVIDFLIWFYIFMINF